MPNTLPLETACSALPAALPNSALLTCAAVAALLAIGCTNAGDGLADAARNISKRSSQLEGRGDKDAADEEMSDEGAEGSADEEMMADGAAADEGAEGDAPAGDDAYDPTPNGPTEGGRKLKTEPVMAAAGPTGDDSVRCGDGVLDLDELCDVAIEAGEEGACPTECEPLDACHAAKLDIKGCWTQCALGAAVPCE